MKRLDPIKAADLDKIQPKIVNISGNLIDF